VRRNSLFTLLVLLVVFSLALAACQPAATATPVEPTTPPVVEEPTEAPAPTEAVEEPTEAVEATEPAATGDFTPMVVEAPDCDYGPAAAFRKVEALDLHTVKFTLCNPDPSFASKVAFSAFQIQDKDYLDEHQGNSVTMVEPTTNGTGPYMLEEWVRGDHITLVRNPNYHGEAPKVDTVIFRWSEEAAQRLLELQSGTVDGIDTPAPEDFETIEGDANLALYPRDAVNVFYIGFNVDMEPFNNETVRQAFAMAIDRQRIVDDFYPPNVSTVAEQFVPPVLKPGYTDGLAWYEYDPAAAQQMLEDAGFADLEITLTYRNVVRAYLPNPVVVAQDIQAQLAEIGVTVTLEEMESTAFIDATAAGEKAFYLLGWNADYPDSSNFYDYHFANANNLQFGTLFDDIANAIRAGGSTADNAERQASYDEVNELLKQHVPMIPVAHGGSATAYKASVEGAHSSPLANENFAVMDTGTDQFVWMQNGEPGTLWCSDETDGETLRACEQIYEALLGFETGGVEVVPALAETWEPNADLTEWTFNLKEGVKFSNGADFDANDVVASYEAQWNAESPNHTGRQGNFEYFGAFFGSLLNAPPAE